MLETETRPLQGGSPGTNIHSRRWLSNLRAFSRTKPCYVFNLLLITVLCARDSGGRACSQAQAPIWSKGHVRASEVLESARLHVSRSSLGSS